MPKYVVTSDTPITAQEVGGGGEGIWGPTDPRPGWGLPKPPGFPERPAHPIYPTIPPRDEWPPLPPLGDRFPPGVSLPIPPTPEHPIAPLPDDPDIDPPTVWPPVRPDFPELPDMSGKSLVLALLYVSRHEPVWAWVVIDHEEAKEKIKTLVEKWKNRVTDPGYGVEGPPPREPK